MNPRTSPIRLWFLGVPAVCVPLLCGCMQPTQTSGTTPQQQNTMFSFMQPPAPKPAMSDPSAVARVVCFYSQNPWMSFDVEGDPNPEGFRFTVYLASGKTGRGVLVPGQLRIEIFRIDHASGGRQNVCDTRVDLADLPRAAKETTLGWGYVCPFTWGSNADPKMDLLGHDIDVVVSYIAPDGQAIRAQTKSLRVPSRRTR
jgi:hypothetical protein